METKEEVVDMDAESKSPEVLDEADTDEVEAESDDDDDDSVEEDDDPNSEVE